MERVGEVQKGKFMFHPSQIYVVVDSKDINNNNFAPFAPYVLTELSGEPYVIPKVTGQPQCELCFRIFPKFSALYKHQGKLCYLDGIAEPHPIKVHFPKSQLFYIKDALQGLGKEIIDDGTSENVYITHDAAYVTILLRQLYTAQVTKYNIEQWYPNLEKISNIQPMGVTAKTVFLELSNEDLNVITGLAKTKLAENLGMERRLTNAELQGEDNLLEKISSIMEPGKKYFCRFSTRSPKDGVSVSEEDKKLDITNRLKKKLNLLAVTSAEEVINLITRSQRVFSDINFYFQYNVPGSTSGKLNLILRDFVENLPIDHEFRCYVRDRKMTAISQYQCYCKFPILLDEEHVIQCKDVILKFHELIKESLPMPDYVIDIVVFPDYTCHVIELNPFGAAMSSGSALYCWVKDYELLYGNLGLDFVPIRILENLTDEENIKGV